MARIRAGLRGQCLARHRRAQGHAAPKSSTGSIRRSTPALADPKMKARFADSAACRCRWSPAEFGKLIANETEKWGKVIKFAGIKADRRSCGSRSRGCGKGCSGGRSCGGSHGGCRSRRGGCYGKGREARLGAAASQRIGIGSISSRRNRRRTGNRLRPIACQSAGRSMFPPRSRRLARTRSTVAAW